MVSKGTKGSRKQVLKLAFISTVAQIWRYSQIDYISIPLGERERYCFVHGGAQILCHCAKVAVPTYDENRTRNKGRKWSYISAKMAFLFRIGSDDRFLNIIQRLFVFQCYKADHEIWNNCVKTVLWKSSLSLPIFSYYNSMEFSQPELIIT